MSNLIDNKSKRFNSFDYDYPDVLTIRFSQSGE